MWSRSRSKRLGVALLIIGWVTVTFLIAQSMAVLLLSWFVDYATTTSLGINLVLVQTVGAVLTYGLMVALLIGVPWAIWNKRTTMRELGLVGLPTWVDIVLPIAGYIVYLVLAYLFTILAERTIPGFDVHQEQQLGYSTLSNPLAYALAFVSLVILAPVMEEIVFRGYLLAKLRLIKLPIWLVVLLVSVVFGAAHGQWNIAVNVFALSIVLCILRLITGTLWASILLHAMKNGTAYYILFINTSFLTTIGG